MDRHSAKPLVRSSFYTMRCNVPNCHEGRGIAASAILGME